MNELYKKAVTYYDKATKQWKEFKGDGDYDFEDDEYTFNFNLNHFLNKLYNFVELDNYVEKIKIAVERKIKNLDLSNLLDNVNDVNYFSFDGYERLALNEIYGKTIEIHGEEIINNIFSLKLIEECAKNKILYELLSFLYSKMYRIDNSKLNHVFFKLEKLLGISNFRYDNNYKKISDLLFKLNEEIYISVTKYLINLLPLYTLTDPGKYTNLYEHLKDITDTDIKNAFASAYKNNINMDYDNFIISEDLNSKNVYNKIMDFANDMIKALS